MGGSQSVAKPGIERALVTGATGFIGQALMTRLDSLGVAATGTCRQAGHVEGSAMPLLVGDVCDADFVRSTVSRLRPDVIFHLAARVNGRRAMTEVQPMLSANLVGSVNVLEAATEIGCRRIVLVGSGDEPVGDDPAASPYAAAKRCQAVYAGMFHALYGTPVTTARVFMTYGPNQPDESKLVPYVITSIMQGRSPQLGSGRRRCDWVYVDDVVDGLLLLASVDGAEGATIDIGTGVLHTVREVVEIIAEKLDPRVSPEWSAVPDRALEVERAADVSAGEVVLGWRSSTDLRTGLDRAIEWYSRGSQRYAPENSPLAFGREQDRA